MNPRDYIKFDYCTRNPNVPSPKVFIKPGFKKDVIVEFVERAHENGEVVVKDNIKGYEYEPGVFVPEQPRQWFSFWEIYVKDAETEEIITYDVFNPEGKNIFIKIDSKALGDTIAWIPYIQQFKDQWKCTVICSTFYNSTLIDVYPDIMFVSPGTEVYNIYAQFFVGVRDEKDESYSPCEIGVGPLQKVATDILGLEYTESRPNLKSQLEGLGIKDNAVDGKYVCISEYASGEEKHWKGDWQEIVDYINDLGYKVLVISKEPTKLKSVLDFTGADTILYPMAMLKNASLYIGLSSGLSWLAWSLDVPVVMISDVTPLDHEFTSNMTRLSANPDLKKVDFDAVGVTSSEDVKKAVRKHFLNIDKSVENA